MTVETRVGIIGLGYVGLPVAVAFAKKFPGTVGFDINRSKIEELRSGTDRTGEISQKELESAPLHFTSDISDLKDCNFFVVAVPTPVDEANIPDLTPVMKASETVGQALKPGDIIVYESTVYPGVTEEVCSPILEKISGLKSGIDFKLGYSPERINPGDKDRTLSKIIKVVSAQDEESLDRVAEVYGAIIDAGVYRAQSIKVAEAAKVIENTQRDLNIALINELSVIFDRLGISTQDVLAAARTKWNFLDFKPGLVGGHCIGVDPYYLTYKAEALGYHPQVILAGRRINDQMSAFVAQKAVKLMLQKGIALAEARVGILGLTFKENVPDIRNSKVPGIAKELADYGIRAMICDPMVEAEEALHEYNIALQSEDDLKNLDVLIFAVPHKAFLAENAARVTSKLKDTGVLIDVKAAVKKQILPPQVAYWSL